MGADQLPLGMNLVSADVALVGRNADFLIDAGESAQFFDVPVLSKRYKCRSGRITNNRTKLFQTTECNYFCIYMRGIENCDFASIKIELLMAYWPERLLVKGQF